MNFDGLSQDSWKSVVIGEDSSIRTAIDVINKGGLQLAIIVNLNGGFLRGLITDSDLRKGLLKGFSLDDKVKKIMNPNPFVVSQEIEEEASKEIMRLNHFFHLPIVTDDGRVVGLHVAEQLGRRKTRHERLVIMAGGRGKRLMPLTTDTPKPMLPVRGKPMLEHLITRAHANGFNKIILSVNYKADKIKDYFGDGEKFGVSIEYIHEDSPLGTAGALSLLPTAIRIEPIVVTNADLVTDASFGEMVELVNRDNLDGLMAVRVQEWQSPFGIVESKGKKIVSIKEKPSFQFQVNAGIYVVGQKLISLLEHNMYCDMPELFERGIAQGLDLDIYPLHETWMDIGRLDEYEAAQT